MKVFNHPTLGDISLSSVLQAVADPCRQKIIATLLKAEGRALACNEFDLDVSKATASHHFEALRNAGIIESHAKGVKCLSQLREEELNERFPGLLKLISDES
jgi:DNA-binding transcriptional ArsR family regulator